MAKTLDLNTVKRPTLEIVLQDEAHTRVRVSTPTEALVQELQEVSPEMLEIMETNNQEGVKAVYDLAARLISCNRDFFQVTGEELREKYRMDLESALIFFSAYLDFINEINHAKN